MKKGYYIFICFVGYLFTCVSVNAQVGSVHLTVELPGSGIQKDSAVFIAGSFNGWNPRDSNYCMKRIDSKHYTLKIPCFYHKKYEYKYTLGSWDAVERTTDGKTDINNRTFTARKRLKIKDQVAQWNIPEPAIAKDTANQLTAKQIELLTTLKDSIEKAKPVIVTCLVEVIQKMNQNLLAEQPSDTLNNQYSEELGDALGSIFVSLGDVFKQMAQILTPEQKQQIREAMKEANAPMDLPNLIGKLVPEKK
jgi:hypothetical protein